MALPTDLILNPETKLSRLLEIALSDLREAEKNPNVAINMSYWLVKKTPDSECLVCMAGAVLINRFLPALPVEAIEFQPSESSGYIDREWMYVVDKLRQGLIEDALYYNENRKPAVLQNFKLPNGCDATFPVVPYAVDADLFYRDIANLITYLKSFNL